MAQSAFAKAFAQKAGKSFDKKKVYKHREGGSFGPVDMPDGSFTGVVTLETSVPTKGKFEGVPIVRAKARVNQGPHEGKEPSQTYFCEGKQWVDPNSDEMPTAEQQLLGLLSWLLPDIQIDDQSQVPDAIELVNERGPLCIIGVKNTKDKNDPTKIYQNVYFNKLVKPATFETDAAQAEATNDEPTQVEENEYVPAKGDMVFVEDDETGTEYEVAQVSQSKQTVNLVDSEGTKKNGIAWASLQPA